MKQFIKQFEDIVDTAGISSSCLANFTDDCILKLAAHNKEDEYSSIMQMLHTSLDALEYLLSRAAIAKNTQKVNAIFGARIITLFRKTMCAKESAIAYCVGGFNSAAFQEFYPDGTEEYSLALNENIPSLINRVNELAFTYDALLGNHLTAALMAFDTNWKQYVNIYYEQENFLKYNSLQCIKVGKMLKDNLLAAMHTLDDTFAGKEEMYTDFLNFGLLLQEQLLPVNNIVAASSTFAKNNSAENNTEKTIGDSNSLYNNDTEIAYIDLKLIDNELMTENSNEQTGSRNIIFFRDNISDVNYTFLQIHNLGSVHN